MQFAVLGWPEDSPTLRLDFRRFRYAGKFVMSNTGKAVLREDGADGPPGGAGGGGPPSGADIDPAEFDDGVLAAAAFNEDRTDPGVLWLRYVTVRDDRRGEGLGPALAARVASRAEDRGYRRLRIAVNNPFAYQALYKAGFVYTGRETGLAELVLERPGPRDAATYQCGLDAFRDRDLSAAETAFLADREGADPPPLVDAAARRLAAGAAPGSGAASGPGSGSTELAGGPTPPGDPD